LDESWRRFPTAMPLVRLGHGRLETAATVRALLGHAVAVRNERWG